MNRLRTLLPYLGLALFLAAIQFVPYGKDHTNPPAIQEPAWDSPRTRQLAKRACFDCHSHETVWPLHANVAPFSWFMMNDVETGRMLLNFSAWSERPDYVQRISTVIRNGSMPPIGYQLLHPSAVLSPPEVDALLSGLDLTLNP